MNPLNDHISLSEGFIMSCDQTIVFGSLNTSKTLQFARVFHYDKTRRAFFDGDAFYFAEDTTAARKDLALFDPVWERHKSLGKQRKEMRQRAGLPQ